MCNQATSRSRGLSQGFRVENLFQLLWIHGPYWTYWSMFQIHHDTSKISCIVQQKPRNP